MLLGAQQWLQQTLPRKTQYHIPSMLIHWYYPLPYAVRLPRNNMRSLKWPFTRNLTAARFREALFATQHKKKVGKAEKREN